MIHYKLSTYLYSITFFNAFRFIHLSRAQAELPINIALLHMLMFCTGELKRHCYVIINRSLTSENLDRAGVVESAPPEVQNPFNVLPFILIF